MPGANRTASFFRQLPKYGWQPTVITIPEDEYRYRHAEPSHLSESDGVVRVSSRELKNFEELARKLRIMRLFWFFLYPLFWEKPARWARPLLHQALALAKQQRFDAILTSSSPMVTAIVAKRLKEELGIPWIWDRRDPYSQDPNFVWPSYCHYRLMRWFEQRWLRHADRVLFVTPTMKRDLLRDFPQISAAKVMVVENGYPDEYFDLEKPTATEKSSEQPFNIVYTGTLRFQQPPYHESSLGWLKRHALHYHHTDYDFSTRSPLALFEALKIIRQQQPQLYREIRVEIIGRSDPRNIDLCRQLGLQQVVQFMSTLPYNATMAKIKQADLLFLPMERRLDGSSSAYVSTKIYEYMASGNPVLLIADPGDAATLIEKAHCGIRCNFGDYAGVAKQIVQFMQSPTEHMALDREFVTQHSRQQSVRQLAEILDSLVAG